MPSNLGADNSHADREEADSRHVALLGTASSDSSSATLSLSLIVRLLPQHLCSRIVGVLTRIKLPKPLRVALLRWYVRRYRVDLSEVAEPLEAFPHLAAFFVRELKPGLRSVEGSFVSPVDGVLRRWGAISAGLIPQVKGLSYSLAELLAVPEWTAPFACGTFLNFYLSPRDYHHVHAPVDGEIVGWAYIPGTLWPVNDRALHSVKGLFAKNERLVILLRTARGQVALTMVGALNVGKISMAFDAMPGAWGGLKVHRYSDPLKVKAGERLGTFHLGSAVVLLLEGAVEPEASYPAPVKWGQQLKLASK